MTDAFQRSTCLGCGIAGDHLRQGVKQGSKRSAHVVCALLSGACLSGSIAGDHLNEKSRRGVASGNGGQCMMFRVLDLKDGRGHEVGGRRVTAGVFRQSTCLSCSIAGNHQRKEARGGVGVSSGGG